MEGTPRERNIPPKDELEQKASEIPVSGFTRNEQSTSQNGVDEVEKEGAEETQIGQSEIETADTIGEVYEAYKEPIEVQEYNNLKEEYTSAIAQWDRYIEHAIDESGHSLSEEELEHATNIRERIRQEMIEVSANYPGDWTALLYKRLTDPVTKEKFLQRRTEAMAHMEDDPSNVGRREKPKSYYQDQIDNYDTNISRVFSKTEVGSARSFGSRGRNLGNQGNEEVGAVFSDAEHRGIPLTNRQKNIIEAHEKGHCLRDFVSPYDRQEVQNTIDREVIAELNALRQEYGNERIAPTYVSHPMEIVERMAQFKNYFGMGASEQFTKQHLDYIREHYIPDTGLDNGVSDLLYVITQKSEKVFLDVINKYPI